MYGGYLVKKVVLVLISLLFVGCDDGGGADTNTDAQQKVGFYFSFDDSGAAIIDSSGNDNNATANAISRVDGKIGTAVKFQTVGSIIELENPREAFPTEESLTFMAWIKTDHVFTLREQIIGGWTGGPPGDFYPINNFGISIVDNRISFEVSAYPNMLSILSDVLPIGIDQWFHIAVTYNGDQVKFYYNGALLNEGSIISNFANNFTNHIGQNFHVFAGITVLDQFFGYIDELYLVGEILTADQIMDTYNLATP